MEYRTHQEVKFMLYLMEYLTSIGIDLPLVYEVTDGAVEVSDNRRRIFRIKAEVIKILESEAYE